MKDFYVYMYLRSNNSKHGIKGSPYYIGKGRKKRAFDTRRHIHRPSDNSQIIFIAENLSEIDAFQIEMLFIYLHGRIDIGTGILRNRTDGGEGQRGVKHSDEWKTFMSQWMKSHPNRGNEVCPKWPKGKPKSEEQKQKQREAWTPELRQRVSDFHKGKRWGLGSKCPKSPEWRKQHSERMKGHKSGMTGKRHSEESRRKMSESHKRKVIS